MHRKFILAVVALVMVVGLTCGLVQVFGPPDPAPTPAQEAWVMGAEIDASLVFDQANITITGDSEIAPAGGTNLTNLDVYLAVGSLTTLLGIALVLTFITIKTNRTASGADTMKTRVWRLGAAI